MDSGKEKNNRQHIGQRIKLIRKKKGIKAYEAARDMGIAQSSYSGYENDFRNPDYSKLKKIAEYYGVSTDYILGLTNDPSPPNNEKDIFEYLNKENLTFRGVPLNDRELKPILDLLEVVAHDRIPGDKNDNAGSD